MLRKDFILCKTRNLLTEFIASIAAKADRRRRKFRRQAGGTNFAPWPTDCNRCVIASNGDPIIRCDLANRLHQRIWRAGLANDIVFAKVRFLDISKPI